MVKQNGDPWLIGRSCPLAVSSLELRKVSRRDVFYRDAAKQLGTGRRRVSNLGIKNGAIGMSDIEGKAATVAASECGR